MQPVPCDVSKPCLCGSFVKHLGWLPVAGRYLRDGLYVRPTYSMPSVLVRLVHYTRQSTSPILWSSTVLPGTTLSQAPGLITRTHRSVLLVVRNHGPSALGVELPTLIPSSRYIFVGTNMFGTGKKFGLCVLVDYAPAGSTGAHVKPSQTHLCLMDGYCLFNKSISCECSYPTTPPC